MKAISKERTQEMIKVMQAYVDGKRIEAIKIGDHRVANEHWSDVTDSVSWSWQSLDYRVKKTPGLIPYHHREEFRRDYEKHGRALVYKTEPDIYISPLTISDKGVDFYNIKTHNVCHIDYYPELLEFYQWADGTPCGILFNDENE